MGTTFTRIIAALDNGLIIVVCVLIVLYVLARIAGYAYDMWNRQFYEKKK